jgi:hypothetical protein
MERVCLGPARGVMVLLEEGHEALCSSHLLPVEPCLHLQKKGTNPGIPS